MPSFPRLLPCGDAAVTVEFGDSIDAAINARVTALDRAVREAELPGVVECVPTYRSLMVHLDPLTADHAALYETLRGLAQKARTHKSSTRRWTIPVVYGGEFGEDLEGIAERHGMSQQEAVEIHAGAIYRVYMIGFMPGFTYLGGLDARLATPRRPTPRKNVPAGAIAIGGAQASIGTAASPSGWHLIGRTPVRCFDKERESVVLFEVGDEVVFKPVPAADWERLEVEVAAGARLATVDVQ